MRARPSTIFERMNELELYLPSADGMHDGYTTLLGGPAYPYHARFNPGDAIGLGYEDLKVLEAHNFLMSIAEGVQRRAQFCRCATAGRSAGGDDPLLGERRVGRCATYS